MYDTWKIGHRWNSWRAVRAWLRVHNPNNDVNVLKKEPIKREAENCVLTIEEKKQRGCSCLAWNMTHGKQIHDIKEWKVQRIMLILIKVSHTESQLKIQNSLEPKKKEWCFRHNHDIPIIRVDWNLFFNWFEFECEAPLLCKLCRDMSCVPSSWSQIVFPIHRIFVHTTHVYKLKTEMTTHCHLYSFRNWNSNFRLTV